MRSLSILCLAWSGLLGAAEPWAIIETLPAERALAVSPAVIEGVRVAPRLDSFAAATLELTLSLPDGTRVQAQLSEAESRNRLDYTWFGFADGDPEQQVVLTRVGSQIAGYLSLRSGIYELTPSAGGTLLLKLESARFPTCAGAVAVPMDAHASGRIRISVSDNGCGIATENLTRIFAHGFTTRVDGHGFGLNSGALAAAELGGSLIATREGLGKGASFILELPLKVPGVRI